jgi:hypothetical protein
VSVTPSGLCECYICMNVIIITINAELNQLTSLSLNNFEG